MALKGKHKWISYKLFNKPNSQWVDWKSIRESLRDRRIPAQQREPREMLDSHVVRNTMAGEEAMD